MSTPEYLFPRRQDRRDFLRMSGAAAAGLALGVPGRTAAAEPSAPVRIGSGSFTYELDPNWGKLPQGMKYGFGCAVVVDGQGRIYVTSRSESPCVAIFDSQGQLLETWSKDFADKVGYSTKQVSATAHGLYWSKEGNQEFLYFTENVAKGADGNKDSGRRVYKTDLQGKIVHVIGNVEQESDTSAKFDFKNPTDVAVAPNGDIYVVDGYGSQLMHRFDKNFELIKTIGGPGNEHGKFKTCHGVWVNTLKAEPELYVADRSNGRIEVFSLEMDYKRTLPDFRAPCCFYQHAGHLYIPELSARVSVLDADDKVVARLGDGAGVKKEELPSTPDKFATPHALCVDAQGDLYVVEWLAFGRPRKFRHVKA
jgi:DNA-binding beta-propeller fold protein YncE